MAATDTASKPMTTAQVGKAYFAAHAEKDLDAAVKLFKEGGIDRLHGLAELKSRAEIKAYFQGLYDALPDYRFEVLEFAASGQQAACRWHVTGTFLGPGRFQGLSPTGAKLDMEGCDMLRVEDGLIVENNAYVNGAQLAQQLGVLPAPGSVGDRAFTGAFNAKTAAQNALRKLRDN
jgi:predicted ester cyclase